MKDRRSPWINDRTALLLEHLGTYEQTLPEDVARQCISDHLDLVSERMRVGRQAARYYVTDDVIKDLAAELVGAAPADDGKGNVVSLLETRRKRRTQGQR